MGLPPQTPSPPQLYSQDLQLKLYQAFIFSIPILFSIILFLLFYLFYLKKRTNTTASSSSATQLTENSIHDPFSPDLSSATSFKGMIKEKLPIILFDEDARTRETLCCVCLGEFKVNEELHLLPPCNHFFHTECIRLWLRSNTTCPLCRCSVIIGSAKNSSHSDEPFHHVSRPNEGSVVQSTGVGNGIRMERQEHPIMVGLSIDNNCTGQQHQQTVPDEQSSSGSRNSAILENGINSLQSESVVINIHTHDT